MDYHPISPPAWVRDRSLGGTRPLRDGLDLATPAGRLMANVLASVAQYETEVRAERILAGIEVARAAGVRFGRPDPAARSMLGWLHEEAFRAIGPDGPRVRNMLAALVFLALERSCTSRSSYAPTCPAGRAPESERARLVDASRFP